MLMTQVMIAATPMISLVSLLSDSKGLSSRVSVPIRTARVALAKFLPPARSDLGASVFEAS